MSVTNSKLSRLKGEWFIAAGILIIIFASIVKGFWPVVKPTTITTETWEAYKAQKQAWQFRLFESIENFGLLVVVLSFINTGIRSFRRSSASIRSIGFTIIGLAICFINLYTLYVSHGISKSVTSLPRPNLELMQQALKKPDMPLNDKAKLSKQYAHDRYLYDGVKEQYISETGQTVIYGPTKEDDQFKEKQLLAKRMWEENEKATPYSLYYWVIVTIAGLLLGLFTPIQKGYRQS